MTNAAFEIGQRLTMDDLKALLTAAKAQGINNAQVRNVRDSIPMAKRGICPKYAPGSAAFQLANQVFSHQVETMGDDDASTEE